MPSDDGQGVSDPALEKTVSAHEAGVTPGGDGGRLSAGTKLGRYEIVEFIGGGGMGWVYRAKDTELERDVAIKVVQPTVAGPKGRDRLLAEARAMAKLRHRAVVPVFDVGEYAGGVYVAMALVKGGTLHDWMHAEARPWRQVVARFLEAGRGLVAAHAAGIVHRDFKPRNVLLGESGEVMVADFGIASASAEATENDGTARTREATSIAGTPAYMAPEQAAGQAVDARADQYSFCVSLWEGLYGQRPQEAETRTQGALLERSPAAPKSRRRVPSWLTDAVARGFAPTPEKRWPTLAALLERLERGMARRRRVVFGVASVTAVAVVAGVFWAARREPEGCPDPRERVAAAWSERVKAEVTAAFTDTGLPYARATLERIVPTLDRYAADWRLKQLAYCRAARIEKRESSQLFDQRMACLERGLAAVRGRAAGFLEAPRATIAVATAAVASLPALADCDDTASLTAFPLPASGDLRERVATIERELDRLAADAATGLRPEKRVTQLEAQVAAARILPYPPVLARALNLLEVALRDAGAPTDQVARELIQVAALARDDVRVFRGWVMLLEDLIDRQHRMDEAKTLEPAAIGALTRSGTDPDDRAWLLQVRSLRAARSDEFDEALALIEQALDVASPSRRSNILTQMASILALAGRPADAIPILEEALRSHEAELGPDHPDIGNDLTSLARQETQLGKLDEAERHLERALKILEAALGPDHKDLGNALRTRGNLELARGDQRAGLPFLQRAVAVLEKANNQTELGLTLGALATATNRVDGLDAARPVFERALAALEASVGKEHQSYIFVEMNYANALMTADDCSRSRQMFLHAQDYFDARGARGMAMMGRASVANCDSNAGAYDAAIRGYDQVIAYCRASECPREAMAGSLMGLAGALYSSGRDRARAFIVAREARSEFVRMGNQRGVAQIDEWLKRHPR